VRLDFLAEIFWSSANHEPGDEHCKDYKNNHAVQSRAHAPKYHFTEHDIDQWDHAAQWRKGVMHAVNRATARIRGHRRKKRRVCNSEAHLFAFHVAAGLHSAHCLIRASELGIAPRFSPIRGRYSREKQ